MADTDPSASTGRETGTGPPRWVKVSAIIAGAAFVLLIVALLLGGGEGHGPGRHTTPSVTGQQATPP